MKAILRFDLSDLDDRRDHEVMLASGNMLRIISDFKNVLRQANKYGMNEQITNREEAAEYFQDQFHHLLSEYPIPEEY